MQILYLSHVLLLTDKPDSDKRQGLPECRESVAEEFERLVNLAIMADTRILSDVIGHPQCVPENQLGQ